MASGSRVQPAKQKPGPAPTFSSPPLTPVLPYVARQVELPYHVRVLVPCYKEDLAIVRRTIMAAYDSLLPAGTVFPSQCSQCSRDML